MAFELNIPPFQLVVPVLVGVAVICVGGAVLLGRYLKTAPVRSRLQALGGGTGWVAPVEGGPSKLTSVAGSVGTAVSSGRTSAKLREQLAQAGYYGSSAATIYLGARMILLFFGVVVTAAAVIPTSLALPAKIFLVLCFATILSYIPGILVSKARSRRRQEVRSSLPDAIDLLEVCASAGMGLDMAWNSVADEVRGVSAILADEMALTNLEIHLGAHRAEAMKHMALRTGAEELSSLVAVMVQSERFGTSISDALRNFAISMRESRSQRAQEAAEKLAVKLILPMIMFIFPALMLVMMGPAFLALLQAFHVV